MLRLGLIFHDPGATSFLISLQRLTASRLLCLLRVTQVVVSTGRIESITVNMRIAPVSEK